MLQRLFIVHACLFLIFVPTCDKDASKKIICFFGQSLFYIPSGSIFDFYQELEKETKYEKEENGKGSFIPVFLWGISFPQKIMMILSV